MTSYRLRRLIIVLILLFVSAVPLSQSNIAFDVPMLTGSDSYPIPADLAALEVKGRAPKTGYARTEFGNGWGAIEGCDVRNVILARDMTDVLTLDGCKVSTGKLLDPYTATTINFQRGADTSDDVQIDHVVALSNAWQTGAQRMTYVQRVALANDPLNLLAVDGPTNEQKSDGDAATWLPPNKPFRCQYVKRQIQVKMKYELWVTSAEKAAMARVLANC